MKISSILILLILYSCATVKKDKTNSVKVNQKKDSSTVEGQYVRETTTIKTSVEPYKIESDSVSLNGFVNIKDKQVFHQVTKSSDIILSTTLKPVYKNGITVGYNLSSKANTIPKTNGIPVNVITTTKEFGKIKETTNASTTQVASSQSATKSTSGINKGLWFVIIFLIISIIMFVTYKSLK